MTEEEKACLALLRTVHEGPIFVYKANQSPSLRAELDSYVEKGYLRLETRHLKECSIFCERQQVYVLDLDGRARLEELEALLLDERPSAKVRRAGKWICLKVRDVVFMALGALLLELLKRLL